jgi:hypothetical protein
MRTLVFALSIVLFSASSSAQAVNQDAIDWIYEKLWESADYLRAGEPDPYSISTNQQFAALMGREDLIPTEREFHLRKRQAPCGVSIGPIAQTLLAEAETAQIVIFNEAHMMPLHRAGTLGIVEALVEAGFTHYAYESFGEKITNRTEPYIRADDSFYSNDPIHARLLRQLKAKGIKLIPYEDNREESREVAQALNLKERVFDQTLSAKLIVIGGWDHVIEHRYNEAGGMMAHEVKELTGHDPLTISQTDCYATTYQPVLAKTRLNKNGAEEAFNLTDFMIGHPQLTFTKNRPDWRRAIGDVDTPVPAAFLEKDVPVIIEARRPGEPDLAVPDERLLLLPGETDIPLLLPPGTYRVEAFTQKGKIGDPVIIEVAAP